MTDSETSPATLRQQLNNQLGESLGPQGIVTEPAELLAYTRDLLGASSPGILAVLRPANTEQVSLILQWCYSHQVTVVPQGGLTGLCHAAIPAADDRTGLVPGGLAGTVILALDRMNKILSIDPLANTMLVEAGVVLETARQAAEAEDRYLPLSHGAVGSSQIGGNLSTNSGGNNALRYGTARDQVLGLEVVLADGSIWDGLKGLRKNTAGIDLKHVFIGAEGTLGVITAAVLKLRPFPKRRATALVATPSPDTALALLRVLESQVGETIAAFELLSGTALRLGLELDSDLWPSDQTHEWQILVELETPAMLHDIDALFEAGLEEGISQGLVADAVIAQSSQQRETMWRLREISARYFIENKGTLTMDTAVPVSRVPDFIVNTTDALTDVMPGVRCAPFGHLGDGNIHFDVARPVSMSDDEFISRRKSLAAIIERESLELGGTISAEHGIGRLKAASLANCASPVELALMHCLKSALDPRAQMNPGVMLNSDSIKAAAPIQSSLQKRH